MQKPVSWTRRPQEFPAGTVVGGWRVAITNASDGGVRAVQDVAADVAQVTFELDTGDYVASVSRLDAAGNVLHTKASDPFNVPAPAPVVIDVADVVTVGDPVTAAVADQVTA